MITQRNTNVEMSTHGLRYMHEQRYGIITSLSIHSIIFMLFLVLSLAKSNNDFKTFYIQFTQMGEQTVQAHGPSKEIKKPKVYKEYKEIKENIVQTRHKQEVKEEAPLIKEPPVKEHEAAIINDAIESHDAVKVGSSPVPETSESYPIYGKGHQGNEGIGSGISYTASSNSASSGIEPEFGNRGAPAFLKRQMPLYPMVARKLGKEGKVVLRLFINEKGRLLNVEVVEQAGYGFTESAVEAVKMSTFSPANENGVNIASKALLTIRFVLKRN